MYEAEPERAGSSGIAGLALIVSIIALVLGAAFEGGTVLSGGGSDTATNCPAAQAAQNETSAGAFQCTPLSSAGVNALTQGAHTFTGSIGLLNATNIGWDFNSGTNTISAILSGVVTSITVSGTNVLSGALTFVSSGPISVGNVGNQVIFGCPTCITTSNIASDAVTALTQGGHTFVGSIGLTNSTGIGWDFNNGANSIKAIFLTPLHFYQYGTQALTSGTASLDGQVFVSAKTLSIGGFATPASSTTVHAGTGYTLLQSSLPGYGAEYLTSPEPVPDITPVNYNATQTVGGPWVEVGFTGQPHGGAADSFTQKTSGSCTSCSSLAVSYVSGVTSGHRSMVVISWQDSAPASAPTTISSIVDTLTFSYSPLVTNSGPSAGPGAGGVTTQEYISSSIWSAPITSSGSDTVTVTMSATEADLAVEILECNGCVIGASQETSQGYGGNGLILSTSAIKETATSPITATYNQLSQSLTIACPTCAVTSSVVSALTQGSHTFTGSIGLTNSTNVGWDFNTGSNSIEAILSGVVTSVGASSPIVSSGGTTPSISCPTCITTSNIGSNAVTSIQQGSHTFIGNVALVNSTSVLWDFNTGANSIKALVTGVVTSVGGSGPISSSGGTTPTISCSTCITTGNIASNAVTAITQGSHTFVGSVALVNSTSVLWDFNTGANSIKGIVTGFVTTVNGASGAITLAATSPITVGTVGSTITYACGTCLTSAVTALTQGSHTFTGSVGLLNSTAIGFDFNTGANTVKAIILSQACPQGAAVSTQAQTPLCSYFYQYGSQALTSGSAGLTGDVFFPANSLLFAAYSSFSAATAGTGYTNLQGSFSNYGGEYQQIASAGATNFPLTQTTSGPYVEVGVASNPTGGNTATYEESAAASCTSCSSKAVAFGTNVVSGDQVFVAVSWATGAATPIAISTVTDTRSASYSGLVTQNGIVSTQSSQSASMWAATLGSSGADTVTVTMASSVNTISVSILECLNCQISGAGNYETSQGYQAQGNIMGTTAVDIAATSPITATYNQGLDLLTLACGTCETSASTFVNSIAVGANTLTGAITDAATSPITVANVGNTITYACGTCVTTATNIVNSLAQGSDTALHGVLTFTNSTSIGIDQAASSFSFKLLNLSCPTHQWFSSVTSNALTCTQPAVGDISGNIVNAITQGSHTFVGSVGLTNSTNIGWDFNTGTNSIKGIISGVVTSVTGTSPIVSSGGTTPVISCPDCATLPSASPVLAQSTSTNTCSISSSSASAGFTTALTYTTSSTTSGNLYVAQAFNVASPATSALTSTWQFIWGSGSAPACAATSGLGTAVGQPYIIQTQVGAAGSWGQSEGVVITGLAASTTYWFDVQVTDSSSATWVYSNQAISVDEPQASFNTVPTVSQNTNTNTCTHTGAATDLMGGLAATYTTQTAANFGSGNIRATLTFMTKSPATSGDTYKWIVAYGTGSAPACNAATSGTTVGKQFTVESQAAAVTSLAQTETVVIDGLLHGTAYWFDVQATDASVNQWITSAPTLAVKEAPSEQQNNVPSNVVYPLSAQTAGCVTTTATTTMAGLREVYTLTSSSSGTIWGSLTFNVLASGTIAAGSTSAWTVAYGDITANTMPACAAASVGTSVGGTYTLKTLNTVAFSEGQHESFVITGLTAGHTYWFDLKVTNTGSTFTSTYSVPTLTITDVPLQGDVQGGSIVHSNQIQLTGNAPACTVATASVIMGGMSVIPTTANPPMEYQTTSYGTGVVTVTMAVQVTTAATLSATYGWQFSYGTVTDGTANPACNSAAAGTKIGNLYTITDPAAVADKFQQTITVTLNLSHATMYWFDFQDTNSVTTAVNTIPQITVTEAG